MPALALFVSTLAVSGIPYVLPLETTPALSILHAWSREHEPSDERRARLERMCRFVSEPSPFRGTVGVVGPDGYVVAIANVAHPPLTLVDVDTPFTHESYATVLVQALLKADPDLSVSESLDARWQLACCLWRHEAPEADY